MRKTIKMNFENSNEKENILKELEAVGFKCKDSGNLSPYLIIKYFHAPKCWAIREDLYHTDQYSYYNGYYTSVKQVGCTALRNLLKQFRKVK